MENQDLLRQEIMKEFWQKNLSGELVKTTLPLYRHSKSGSELSKTLEWRLPGMVYEQLMKICNHSDLAFFILMTACLNTVLYRYSNNECILIGTTTFTLKENSELNDILLIKSRLDRGMTFVRLLDHVKDVVRAAYKNQEYAFEEIARWFETGDLSRITDILNIALIYENIQSCPESLKKFDLIIRFCREDRGNIIKIEYNQGVYDSEIVDQFAGHFLSILSKIHENVNSKIEDIELLSENEKTKLLADFNKTENRLKQRGGIIPGQTTVPELIVRQAQKSPDAIALLCSDETFSLSYGELDYRCNILAEKLKNQGAGRGTISAVLFEPSVEMIIGILTVLKSGGCYLPIEPEQPLRRKVYICEDTRASFLLTSEYLAERNKETLQKFSPGHVIFVDNIGEYGQDDRNIRIDSRVGYPGDPAYILYTSGTTGRPKGVVIEHRSIIAYMNSFLNEFDIGPGDVFLQQSSYASDIFVEEVFPLLSRGGSVAIAGKNTARNIDDLRWFIETRKVTIISCSPLLLAELNVRSSGNFIHTYISGGDILKESYIDKLLKQGKVYNTYGPTETTVCAAYFEVKEKMSPRIPIGKPILTSRIYILNRDKQVAPAGVVGELFISGDGPARGYLNDVSKTDDKFIPDPFAAGMKMYRSGDLARWLFNGDIDFLGRVDNQVKIRGYRIETGEIETLLLNHRYVMDAAVTVVENKNEGKFLVAYVVSSKKVAELKLRDFLSGFLPDFMIPSHFIKMEQLPVSSSGKVDRKLLSGFEFLTAHSFRVLPRNDVEKKIAAIWAELLQIDMETIGIDADFFELGGHSLKATILTMRILKLFNVQVTLREMYKAPTIRELATLINMALYPNKEALENNDERKKILI